MIGIIFGVILIVVGGFMIFLNYQNRQHPTETKVYQRAAALAEVYTKPWKCKIVGHSSGLAGTYTTIQVIAEGSETYRVPFSCKDDEVGRTRVYYRHKENPFDFVPDYMIYGADVKYLMRRWLFAMMGGVLIVLVGVLFIVFSLL